MPSVVIVTKQCYLLCEAINYIAINEVQDEDEDRMSVFDRPKRGRKTRKPTKKQLDALKSQQFNIIIDFIPANNVNPSNGNGLSKNRGDSTTVAIKVTGRDRCQELFTHMVEQIREQIPDNKFLDQIVEQFLIESREDGPKT
jgi:hypothetical protein